MKRPCLDCRKPAEQTRCADCTRQRDRARGSSAARGYGSAHRSLRTEYERRMINGEPFVCWRCGADIDPAQWHLGHDDYDRTQYRGPECIPCNEATSGRMPHVR